MVCTPAASTSGDFCVRVNVCAFHYLCILDQHCVVKRASVRGWWGTLLQRSVCAGCLCVMGSLCLQQGCQRKVEETLWERHLRTKCKVFASGDGGVSGLVNWSATFCLRLSLDCFFFSFFCNGETAVTFNNARYIRVDGLKRVDPGNQIPAKLMAHLCHCWKH